MTHRLIAFLTIFLSQALFAEVTIKVPQLPSISQGALDGADDMMVWDRSAAVLKRINIGNLDARWYGGGGGGGGAVWGTIIGTLANQTDLQTALNAKQASGNYITALTGGVTATGPGSVTATVATVGGATAANVASATTLALAATNSNTNSAIVKRDSSGNFSAGTVTAALSGNASTSTALAANPTDCSAGNFATAIDASGNLTCAVPISGLAESYTGMVETVSNKTYIIDEYAVAAKQVVNIRAKCASGTVTAKLQIGGSDITTCTGISVSSTAGTTTCSTGSTNDLAANGRLTLVTSSNSSCADFTFAIKTTRD